MSRTTAVHYPRYLPHFLLFSVLLLLSAAALSADVPRTISVDGTGQFSIAPDMARISMSVAESDPSVAVAQQKSAAVSTRILQLVDKLGINREQVNTTGASVRPDYRWNPKTEQQELLGYIAERQFEIELRDLDKLGALVEGAVAAGVNQLSPPTLDTTKRRDAYRKALAAAATDARANAETLAAALGVKLGNVIQINAATSAPPPMPMMRMQADAAMSAEGAAQSYNAGDLQFDTTISAIFALE